MFFIFSNLKLIFQQKFNLIVNYLTIWVEKINQFLDLIHKFNHEEMKRLPCLGKIWVRVFGI